jgi:hypothetical protein
MTERGGIRWKLPWFVHGLYGSVFLSKNWISLIAGGRQGFDNFRMILGIGRVRIEKHYGGVSRFEVSRDPGGLTDGQTRIAGQQHPGGPEVARGLTGQLQGTLARDDLRCRIFSEE